MHTFADPIRRAVQVAPDSTAIISGAQSFTYRQLNERCRRFAGFLSAAGIEAGERVAVLAKNSHAYIEAYVGVPASGRVLVPLNTRHAEPELEYALRDAGVQLLLTDRDPGHLAKCVKRVMNIGEEYESALSAAEERPLGVGIDENTLAGLFYTGGTTGASKGVMLSHRNLIANTISWLATVPQRPEDRYLVVAPLFHAAGSNGVLATIWTTGCQITVDAFEPGKALDLIQEHGATQTLAVPAMLAAMTETQLTAPRNVASMKVIAHGGSPVATEVLRRSHRAFPGAALVELYGATETSPLAVAFVGEERALDSEQLRAAGQPILGCDISVLDVADRSENPREVPRGQVGEIAITGNNVMQGYWNKPEQTAAVLNGRQYRTGDLGYMDDAGFIYLVDRSKDMIVTGGENVYSIEVEEVIYKHEAVLEAAVFGVPHEQWGEAVWAVVVLRQGYDNVEAQQIIDFCKGKIAGYKIPKGLDFRTDPLPKSGPGKVLKRKLREPYWAGQSRSVN